MIEVHAATAGAPKRANEDYYLSLPGLVGVLDGVTQPTDIASTCRHDTAWYVTRLAARITVAHAEQPDAPLSDVLGTAITAVRDDHGGWCDLDSPTTPAATIALLRPRSEEADYLVLCDSYLVVDHGGHTEAITDTRFTDTIARLRSEALSGSHELGSDGHHENVVRVTAGKWNHVNREGGYWIASADPEAAQHAIVGTLSLSGPEAVRRAALLTDGASCAVDLFGLFDWHGLLDVLTEHGPGELIRRVRQAEAANPHGRAQPRYKRHDDATAILCLFDDEEPS